MKLRSLTCDELITLFRPRLYGMAPRSQTVIASRPARAVTTAGPSRGNPSYGSIKVWVAAARSARVPEYFAIRGAEKWLCYVHSRPVTIFNLYIESAQTPLL